MGLKKIWQTILVLSGILVLVLTLNPGKVYAGGINSDGVYGDLYHKKTKKPTYSARTATPTLTLTPTITTTLTPSSTPTLTTTSKPTVIPTKTELPASVKDARAAAATEKVDIEILEKVNPILCFSSPSAVVIGFAGMTWMKLRKRKDDI